MAGIILYIKELSFLNDADAHLSLKIQRQIYYYYSLLNFYLWKIFFKYNEYEWTFIYYIK